MSADYEEGDRFLCYCVWCEEEHNGEVCSPARFGGVPWRCDGCGEYTDLDTVQDPIAPGVNSP